MIYVGQVCPAQAECADTVLRRSAPPPRPCRANGASAKGLPITCAFRAQRCVRGCVRVCIVGGGQHTVAAVWLGGAALRPTNSVTQNHAGSVVAGEPGRAALQHARAALLTPPVSIVVNLALAVQCNVQSMPHGFGYMYQADGTLHEGNFANGRAHGEGKYLTAGKEICGVSVFCLPPTVRNTMRLHHYTQTQTERHTQTHRQTHTSTHTHTHTHTLSLSFSAPPILLPAWGWGARAAGGIVP